MPKSSSFTPPSAGDQHVERLDVAMDDQVGVRMRDRREHVEEQPHARRDVEPALVALVVDALALDVLEHQVRLARRR